MCNGDSLHLCLAIVEQTKSCDKVSKKLLHIIYYIAKRWLGGFNIRFFYVSLSVYVMKIHYLCIQQRKKLTVNNVVQITSL